MNDILSIIGSNVRRYRLGQGLSQELLAEKSGLHRTYIGAIERGERNVSAKNIEKIAKELGVEAHILLLPSSKYGMTNLEEKVQTPIPGDSSKFNRQCELPYGLETGHIAQGEEIRGQEIRGQFTHFSQPNST